MSEKQFKIFQKYLSRKYFKYALRAKYKYNSTFQVQIL